MTETSSGWDLVIRDGEGKVIPLHETLVLEAYANDAETLAIVTDVLERHLRKFASKLDHVLVEWSTPSHDEK